MGDPSGLMKVNYVLLFLIFNPLSFSCHQLVLFLLKISVSFPQFRYFASSYSLPFRLAFSFYSILYLLRLYLCLLSVDPRLFNTFSSAHGSGEPLVVPVCLCHGQKGTGSSFFVRVLRFSPVSIIPPTLHTHSLITDAI